VSDPAPEFLRLEAIHKSFGSFVALREIDLSVRSGELVCFLGPSGCGKTTLLRIIAGLETQSRGRVIQNGRDISRLPPFQRDYGIVFQSYALFPNLTVHDNVAYGLVNRRTAKLDIGKRVRELLELVGLPGSEHRYPSQLSGGQQQRVALARALATSPGLLLLDEPLSALDAKVREYLRQEVRRLQRRLGVTTVMVTHDQEEAMGMSDRVVVMNQGAIEQVGTPEEVYRAPLTPFVADFVGKANVLQAVCVGPGEFDAGGLRLKCGTTGVAQGERVAIYLRPEDVEARNVSDSAHNVVHGRVEEIEFLGATCRANVEVQNGIRARILADFSLKELHELNLAPGSPITLSLPGERMRVFKDKLP
jgi:iron(III) transport system ATP-binding protein